LYQQFRYILYLQQSGLFLLTLWFGYHKWRRHW
jgi:hypothetical protein